MAESFRGATGLDTAATAGTATGLVTAASAEFSFFNFEFSVFSVPASRPLAIYPCGIETVAIFIRQTSTNRFLLFASRKRYS